MPTLLPIDAAYPNYRVGITLQGTNYLFDVRWNSRDTAWYFDLLDETETPIINGTKIVLGAFWWGRSVDVRKPAGMIFATDLSGQGKDATIDDLGTRVVLFHYTVDELNAL